MTKYITEILDNHKQLIENVIKNNIPEIERACELVVETLKNGNKILLCGNGGSAADAQHIAAELTGRFETERNPLPGIALTTDTSALTAIANDYGYDAVFSRQVSALANKNDLLIGISTSGNSANILNAFASAEEKNCKTIALTGKDGGKMKEQSTLCIVINDSITARIQEMHILIGHIICGAVDRAFTELSYPKK